MSLPRAFAAVVVSGALLTGAAALAPAASAAPVAKATTAGTATVKVTTRTTAPTGHLRVVIADSLNVALKGHLR